MRAFNHNKQRLAMMTQKLIKVNYNRVNFKNYEDIILSGTMRFEN